MAERLIAARVLCVGAAVALSPAAAAQAGLPDPTRPPAASAEEGKLATAQEARSAHRLQSVLISPERKLAVIDGHTVPLGGRIDDALLVAITETGVTLRRGGRTEVLPLNAGVQKKDVQR